MEEIPLPKGAAHEEVGPQKALRQTQVKTARQYYYAMVELFDKQMGQLFSLLEQYHALKDTLVVITSDHGDMFYDHGLGEKGPMAYEQVLKVPLIFFGEEIMPQMVRNLRRKRTACATGALSHRILSW